VIGGLPFESRKIMCDYYEDRNISKTCIKHVVKMWCYTEIYSDVCGPLKVVYKFHTSIERSDAKKL
jgi:hypothetical protein